MDVFFRVKERETEQLPQQQIWCMLSKSSLHRFILLNTECPFEKDYYNADYCTSY